MNINDCHAWLKRHGYRLISRTTQSATNMIFVQYEVISPDHWSKRFQEKDLIEWVSKEAHEKETKYVNFMNSMS